MIWPKCTVSTRCTIRATFFVYLDVIHCRTFLELVATSEEKLCSLISYMELVSVTGLWIWITGHLNNLQRAFSSERGTVITKHCMKIGNISELSYVLYHVVHRVERNCALGWRAHGTEGVQYFFECTQLYTKSLSPVAFLNYFAATWYCPLANQQASK